MLDLKSLEQAIESLQDALFKTEEFVNKNSEDFIMIRCLKAGVIQNFEFTYELAWKFIKRWLENNFDKIAVDGVSRRELYRIAIENKLIDDVDVWMEYHNFRNLTFNSYDVEIADKIYEISKEFFKDCDKLLKELHKKND
jgi:nucleotidyltransferase substrate binding protein (TIGR01987 family)